MLSKYIQQLNADNELYLRVKVIPCAPKSAIREVMGDDTLKAAVAAPPEKGRANKELIKLLSASFQIQPKNVKIISGAGSRTKLVRLAVKTA